MSNDSSKNPIKEIPEMNLPQNYSQGNLPQIGQIPNLPKQDSQKTKKDLDKAKKDLDKLKGTIIKKFSFIEAISILPPQSIPIFIEEELETRGKLPKEEAEKIQKKIHLQVIIPENKYKEINKIKLEIIKEIEKSKLDVWLHLKTPVDIWELCLDGKFDMSAAIAMSLPLYDKGILGGLRVAEIHKSLVLQKFERYVVSYVIAGSLVRGEAVPTSDVDVFLIINDTDVKRMPRLELKERLRGIIHQYIAEASAIAGVKNKLSPQIYLLTEFWESVKDAQPVIFTFIRDGIPIYDRHTFMPWKALLKMGKLKPSPEAIDMFMSMGDGVISRSKRTLLSDIFVNIFWGISTPSQAMLMLNGNPPPTAKKELVREFKKEFYDTKMIEKKYIDFLEKVVGIWRDYEHEKVKEISGKEIDKLLKDTEDYLKRLKELRIEIEKRFSEKTIEQINKDLFDLLKKILGNKSQEKIVEDFEKTLVKSGKFSQHSLRILKKIIEARKEFKKGKSNTKKIDQARKDSTILINELVEYSQRCDLLPLEKGKMILKYRKENKEKLAELINANNQTFLFQDNTIKKITSKGLESSNSKEVSEAIEKQKSQKEIKLNSRIFEVLKKELNDFEIVL